MKNNEKSDSYSNDSLTVMGSVLIGIGLICVIISVTIGWYNDGQTTAYHMIAQQIRSANKIWITVITMAKIDMKNR